MLAYNNNKIKHKIRQIYLCGFYVYDTMVLVKYLLVTSDRTHKILLLELAPRLCPEGIFYFGKVSPAIAPSSSLSLSGKLLCIFFMPMIAIMSALSVDRFLSER